ncbi:DMT family transporter [Patescibacteria group bacterium]|nr:DMT family transporter [Patescibacteria group bacterium]MBU1953254.1 DMT family transporter [Patescibacteria group bacterium]
MPRTYKTLKNDLFLPHLALVCATVLWGAANPVIKLTLGYVPPLTFLFLRFLTACFILLPYIIYQIQKTKIAKKDLINFFLFGLLSQTSLAFIFVGLEYTTVLETTIIGVLGSIMVVAAGHYFYNDKVNRQVKIGLLVATLGTLFVILEPLITKNFHDRKILERVLGNSLILMYNITWVLFIVWSKFSLTGEKSKLMKKSLSFLHLKQMSKEYSSSLLTATSLYVGLITIMPLALLENMGLLGQLSSFNILSIDNRGILGILYMAIGSSIVAYMIYQWSLKYVTVSDTAFFGYLSPIVTLPFAYLFLGEVPNRFMFIGGLAIAAGVVIAEKNLRT